jgi:hypothetical protein
VQGGAITQRFLGGRVGIVFALRGTPVISMFFDFIDTMLAACSLREHVTTLMSPRLNLWNT